MGAIANDPPLVSVVLPTYNSGKQLLSAVNSILRQSLTDFELIIIDDGSQDTSIEQLLAARILDSRCRLIRQNNRGLAPTLNLGLQEARAPIVARMDADDVSHTSRLERQVQFLDAHKDVVLVGGQLRRVCDEQPMSTSNFPLSHHSIMSGLKNRAHVLSHPTVAFRTSLAQEIGGYWENGVSEDWDFFLRMGELGQVANLPDVVLDYTYGRGSINGRHLKEVRRNMRLAVTNHYRRASNQRELSAPEYMQSMSILARMGLSMETLSLAHYRKSLELASSQRHLSSGVHLVISGTFWPRQAIRRVYMNRKANRRSSI